MLSKLGSIILLFLSLRKRRFVVFVLLSIYKEHGAIGKSGMPAQGRHCSERAVCACVYVGLHILGNIQEVETFHEN